MLRTSGKSDNLQKENKREFTQILGSSQGDGGKIFIYAYMRVDAYFGSRAEGLPGERFDFAR